MVSFSRHEVKHVDLSESDVFKCLSVGPTVRSDTQNIVSNNCDDWLICDSTCLLFRQSIDRH